MVNSVLFTSFVHYTIKIMRYILFLAFTAIISFSGTSQIYYSFGLKGQRVKFLTIYETEEDIYDPFQGWVLGDGIDTSQQTFFVYGPTLCYGFYYDINEKFSVAAELDGFLGFLRFPGGGVYFDFGLGARGSYTLSSASYSNVFLRAGLGYGLSQAFDGRKVIGVNLRAGYEHDFDSFLLGVALDANLYLDDLTGYGSIPIESMLTRKMNSVGLAVYASFGKM
jgi:hypothetical protein